MQLLEHFDDASTFNMDTQELQKIVEISNLYWEKPPSNMKGFKGHQFALETKGNFGKR